MKKKRQIYLQDAYQKKKYLPKAESLTRYTQVMKKRQIYLQRTYQKSTYQKGHQKILNW